MRGIFSIMAVVVLFWVVLMVIFIKGVGDFVEDSGGVKALIITTGKEVKDIAKQIEEGE